MIVLLALLAVLQDDAAAQADAAVAQFRTAYKTPDVKARVEAIAELGKVQQAKVGKILAGLLTTDDPAVRRKAAEMLGLWTSKPAEVGGILRSALKPNGKEPSAMAALFDAIGNLRDKTSQDEVNNSLTHMNNEVSVAAIRAAGKLGCAKSMDRLLAIWTSIHDYHNPRPSLNGGSGPKRTPEMDLRYGMQEPVVKEAVAAITRKTFPGITEARDWWNANRATFKEQ